MRITAQQYQAMTKPRTRRNGNPEQLLQEAVIRWVDAELPGLLYCASAGGMRTGMATAVKMKKAGYRKGFPDLVFYEPRGKYVGLALEIKTEEGSASAEQKQWLQELTSRGWCAKVVKGFDQIQEAILMYFGELI